MEYMQIGYDSLSNCLFTCDSEGIRKREVRPEALVPIQTPKVIRGQGDLAILVTKEYPQVLDEQGRRANAFFPLLQVGISNPFNLIQFYAIPE